MPMASELQTWATKELQNYSVIYRMTSEFLNLVTYGKKNSEKL